MADTELIDHTGRTVFRGTQKPPGGGSQTVACVLVASDPIDLAAGDGYFTWDTIYDNLYDENTLNDLPAGIGIDPASVGTDTLTTTEAGIWALTLIGLGIPNDATWEGRLLFGNVSTLPTITLPVVATGNRPLPLPVLPINLPSGVALSVGLATLTPPTANPFNVNVGSGLVVVRLA